MGQESRESSSIFVNQGPLHEDGADHSKTIEVKVSLSI